LFDLPAAAATTTPDAYAEMTAEIVSAFVSKNAAGPGDLPTLIVSVPAALRSLTEPSAQPVEELKPAVPIRKSITPDYVVCLDDGLKFKSVKRHVASTGHDPGGIRAGPTPHYGSSCSAFSQVTTTTAPAVRRDAAAEPMSRDRQRGRARDFLCSASPKGL
jgi:hypothetical protein